MESLTESQEIVLAVKENAGAVADLEKLGFAMATIANYIELRSVLVGMPQDAYDWIKREVSGMRRDAADETTDAARKLFASAIGIGSMAHVKFTDGKQGLFELVGRQSQKGRAGDVNVTLKNIADNTEVSLSKEKDGSTIAHCKWTFQIVK